MEPRRAKTCTICGKRTVRLSGHLRDHRSGRIDGKGARIERAASAKRPRKVTRAPERERTSRGRRTTTRALTHIDASGEARMVDVGAKADTERRALARGKLVLSATTVALVRDGRVPKGDVLAAARIAGIMAAKRTSELIPLCHPLPLTNVELALDVREDSVEIQATAETVAQTGVEMEALTACAVAALTVYDMAKAIDKEMVVAEIRLLEKTKE